MKKALFIFSFLLLAANVLSIENKLRFHKFTIEQGLPHNYVHAFAQDKNGFLWIGTNYGLARYDGYNFKVYRPDPKDPQAITHKPIGNLFFDSRGYLWMSINSGGINRMDVKKEVFKGYFYDSTKNHSLGKDLSHFYEDKDGNLWLFTQTGIYKFNWESEVFVFVLDKKFKSATNSIASFTDDKLANIWFVNDGKLGILDKQNYEVRTVGQFFNQSELDTINYRFLFSNEKGKIWAATRSSGLLCLNTITKTIEIYIPNAKNLINTYIDRKGNLYAISNAPDYSLFVCRKENIKSKVFEKYQPFGKKDLALWLKITDDQFGNVWVSSTAGIAKFNPLTGLENLRANNFDPNSISSNSITNIFIDNTDNLWISPIRKGINKADLRQKPFKFYMPEIKTLNDLISDQNVNSVFQDANGNLWIGNSKNGITIINKNTGETFHYTIRNCNDVVTTIFPDNNGDMWLGTFWNNTFRIRKQNLPKANKYDQFSISAEEFNIIGVREIAQDDKNNLWLASVNGLICFEQKTEIFTNISASFDHLNDFSWFYRFVYINRNKDVWAGTNSGGLVKFDISEQKFTHYLHDPKNKNSISNNTVYAIHQDKAGIFWIGTGQGVNKFDPVTEIFTPIGESELNSVSVFSLFPDTAGNFWMSTDIGIGKFNIENEKSIFYGNADGINNNEYTTTANYMSNSGEMFFGGTRSLISFIPSEIKVNLVLPKPVLTGFSIKNIDILPGDNFNGRVILEKQIWETSKIKLLYNENDFTIEFSSLHFAAPEKTVYFYKLEGFNENWVKTSSHRRYATYTGLPPGNYTFLLKSTNNDGLLNNEKDNLNFHIIIKPPFWQTIWFRSLLVIALIGGVLLFISVRIKALSYANKILDIKVKERTHELEKVNCFLEERTHELEEANAIMEEKQEEINLQKEEIQAQYETLENANNILLEQQRKIIEQNIELDQHRNKLEYLVEERTKELEKALMKAEESDKLKTSFLTNMSHEIRTPMNAIIGFSSLLRGEEYAEKREDFINIIESNGRSLLTLINDILELSSLQSQQVSLSPRKNNLNDILKKLYDTFKIEADRRKLSLELKTNLIGDSYYITCDEIRLQQTFSNLLYNALKFTEKGGVEFGIHEVNKNIVFFVKDTGIGIPNGVGDSIFERFYKVERNSKQLFRGTGLGLAICKNIVGLWKGQIWYESVPEKGTTFYFTYPLADNNCTDEIKPQTKAFNIIDFSDKCILIAEDEISNYELLEIYLKNTFAKILWAKDGIEVLQFIENQPVDLILMDIKMPKMNGIQASIKIRERFPQLPIIAQTAFAFKNEIEEILSCGINAYLTKPINKTDLLELIRKFI